jgi:hypothetical protein
MEKLATNSPRTITTRRAARPAPASSRGKTTPPARAAKSALQPKLSRLTASVELIPPPGCIATVILKQIDHDEETRYYKWWVMVGRSGDDAFSFHYKHTGEDAIRCDIPEGMALSEDALLPALKAFWSEQSVLPGDPGSSGGGGSGGTTGKKPA